MGDYSHLGLDSRLRPTKSILNNTNQYVTRDEMIRTLQSDPKVEIQTKDLIASNVYISGGTLRITNGGVLTILDAQNDEILTYNASTNAITFSGIVSTSFVGTTTGLIQESRFEFANLNSFTSNDNWEFPSIAADQYPIVQLVSGNWGTNVQFFFDVTANGHAGVALNTRLVNLAGSTAIASTTGTSGTASVGSFYRAGPFVLDSGSVQYGVQFKRGTTGTATPAIISAGITAHHI